MTVSTKILNVFEGVVYLLQETGEHGSEHGTGHELGHISIPEITVFLGAALFGTGTLYYAYLTYRRGGKEAETNMWAYGFISALILGTNAVQFIFGHLGYIPEFDIVNASLLLLGLVFLMLTFRDASKFFGKNKSRS